MWRGDTTDYGEVAWELVRQNLGEARYEQVCQQFELSAADRELLGELMARWRPDCTLEDIVTLCQDYKGRPNIGRVMRTLEAIAREAAQISELRRQGRSSPARNGDD